MSGWWKSNRRQELPANWDQIRREVLRRCKYQCEHVSKSGVRCTQVATDVDHAFHRDEHRPEFLQGLCAEHHKRKTAGESWAARSGARYKGKRKRESGGLGAL